MASGWLSSRLGTLGSATGSYRTRTQSHIQGPPSKAAVTLMRHIFPSWLAMLSDSLGAKEDQHTHGLVFVQMRKLESLTSLPVAGDLKTFFDRVMKPMCWWSSQSRDVIGLSHPEAETLSNRDMAIEIVQMSDKFSDFVAAVCTADPGGYAICTGEVVQAEVEAATAKIATVVGPRATMFLEAELCANMKKAMQMLSCADKFFDFVIQGPDNASLATVIEQAQDVIGKLQDLTSIGDILEKRSIGVVAVNRTQYVLRRCRCLHAFATLMTLTTETAGESQVSSNHSPLVPA